MKSIMLRLVSTATEVLNSLKQFNNGTREDYAGIRRTFAKTEYWVYDPGSKLFAPAKFAGYVGMTFEGYQLATDGNAEKSGALFGGYLTWPAIEKAIKENIAIQQPVSFQHDRMLADRLPAWGVGLLGVNPFKSVNQEKWKFITLPATDDVKMAAGAVAEGDTASPASTQDDRGHILRLICERRGQPKFRNDLIMAYGGRCAVSECDAVDALEASHLDPYTDHPDSQLITNGLLLRADIHTLFDLDLIGFDPDTMAVVLAPNLRETAYSEFHGNRLRVPNNTSSAPHRDGLVRRWQRFVASGNAQGTTRTHSRSTTPAGGGE